MDLAVRLSLRGNILRLILIPVIVVVTLSFGTVSLACGESSSYPGWVEFEIDEISDYDQKPQIAVDPDGNVHMAYWHDGGPRILTYACRTNEGDLTTEEIGTSDSSLVILDTAMAADSMGKVHLVFSVGWNLQYVTNRDGAWAATNLTDMMDVWGIGDIAVDSEGKAHIIACYEGWKGNISYVTDASGTWTVEMISGFKPDFPGSYAVAIDRQDHVHVCFYGYNDTGLSDLWYATNADGGWNFSRVDSLGSLNIYWARPSIAIGDSGEVFLAVTADYAPAASIPSSEVTLYCQSQSDAENPWCKKLVTGSGYLPGKAVAYTSWGSVEMLVNEYSGIQHSVSYNPAGDSWGWSDAPLEAVSCASMDSQDAWHVVYATDYHAREIVYSSNGFDLPDSPLDISAQVDGNSVTISWSPSLETGGLEIECYRITGITLPVDVAPDVTRYTFTGLMEETYYSFDVAAVNQLGESYPSGSYSFTTGLAASGDGSNQLLYGVAVALFAAIVIVVTFVMMRRKRTRGSKD
jgi:hypothetical protein